MKCLNNWIHGDLPKIKQELYIGCEGFMAYSKDSEVEDLGLETMDTHLVFLH